MFIGAQLAFGVDLIGHLPGFLVLTGVTAGAAGSFALTLAALGKARA
jgi:ABC-2 type transport system permease protein